MQADLHVVLHTQVGKQADVLEGAGDAGPVDLGSAHAVGVLAIEQDGAPGGLIHLGEQVEHRGLARAVGADKPAISVRPMVRLNSLTAVRPPKSMPRCWHSRTGSLFTSRSGTMEWLGTGTILPFLNSLAILSASFLGAAAQYLPAQGGEKLLGALVVGGQHDQDEHDGVDQHPVVIEITQQLGQDIEQGGSNDRAPDVAQSHPAPRRPGSG